MKLTKSTRLSKKLIIGIVAFSLMGLAVAFVMVQTVVRAIVYESVMESTRRERKLQMSEVSKWFSANEQAVSNLAMALEHVGEDSLIPIVASFAGSFGHVESVWLATSDGGFYDSDEWTPPDGFVSQERPWWSKALSASGETTITLPYVAAHTGGLVATIAKHIADWRGEEAVVAKNIELDHLVEMVSGFQDMVEGYMILVGPEGEVIIHPLSEYLPDENGMRMLSEIPGYEAMYALVRNGDDMAEIRSNDENGNNFYVIQMPLLASGWTLLAVIPDAVLNEHVSGPMIVIMLAFVLVILLLAVFTYFFLSSRVIKPLGKLKFSAVEMARGNTSVPIEVKSFDEIGQVGSSLQGISQSLNMLEENFVKGEHAHMSGNVLYRLHDTRLEGAFANVLDRANNIAKEFLLSYDALTEPFLYISNEYKLLYANSKAISLTGMENADVCGLHVDDFFRYDLSDNEALRRAMENGTPEISESIRLHYEHCGEKHFQLNAVPFVVDGAVACVLVFLMNTTHIMEMQASSEKLNAYRNQRSDIFTNTVADALENGNLHITFPKIPFDKHVEGIAAEQDRIEEAVKHAISKIKDYVDEITGKLQDIAGNNFDIRIGRDYVGDFGSIKDSIMHISESMSAVINEIQTASGQVETGAESISQSSRDLIASFEEQAAEIAEVREAMSVLTAKTQRNAKDALVANELSGRVRETADIGAKHMDEMEFAMKEIRNSSEEVASVAVMINEIAFQTNLLALNASVEAARAGEHGRGFAIVADEVRNLAGKSASAAQNASEMITKSLDRISEGVTASANTAEALRKIVETTADVTVVVENINHATNEQAGEITKIQNSMDQIHENTSSNVASVQAGAAVSEELSSQASMLRGMVGRFRIGS